MKEKKDFEEGGGGKRAPWKLRKSLKEGALVHPTPTNALPARLPTSLQAGVAVAPHLSKPWEIMDAFRQPTARAAER